MPSMLVLTYLNNWTACSCFTLRNSPGEHKNPHRKTLAEIQNHLVVMTVITPSSALKMYPRRENYCDRVNTVKVLLLWALAPDIFISLTPKLINVWHRLFTAFLSLKKKHLLGSNKTLPWNKWEKGRDRQLLPLYHILFSGCHALLFWYWIFPLTSFCDWDRQPLSVEAYIQLVRCLKDTQMESDLLNP